MPGRRDGLGYARSSALPVRAGGYVGRHFRRDPDRTTYRLEQLEKKVEKHNSLVERTYRLEGQVSLLRDEVEHYTER